MFLAREMRETRGLFWGGYCLQLKGEVAKHEYRTGSPKKTQGERSTEQSEGTSDEKNARGKETEKKVRTRATQMVWG
jgi:hypothetical protein